MADLTGYRREIDEIDAQLIPLLEQRMNVVRKVAAYKKEHQMPVLQAGREQEVLEKATAQLRNPAYAPEAVRFMNAVMEISRAAQTHDIASAEPVRRNEQRLEGRVGFYGEAGSFTEEALIGFFGETRERADFAEFEDVFAALQSEQIVYGVLPIENSSTGSISKVYDLLGRYGFSIVGECRLRIRQNLVGLPGAALDGIRTVYSHEQGIEQSSRFLAQHPAWELTPYCSTSMSAKRVAREGNPAHAAIASERAAEVYGLAVLAPEIQNSLNNTTRFIVIGRTLEPAGANKVSLVFALDHEAGTLYSVLRLFAESRINLVKIESRPIPDQLWNYLFYLDFEGDPDNGEVRSVLEQIGREAKSCRLLGAYQSDRNYSNLIK